MRINIERTILSCGFELQAAAQSKRCGRGGGTVNIKYSYGIKNAHHGQLHDGCGRWSMVGGG